MSLLQAVSPKFIRPIVMLVTILFVLVSPLQAVAAASPSWRYEAERANWWDKTDLPCGKTSINTSGSSTLPADFPEPARTILTNAANTAGTNANVLAAIYMNEHGINEYRTIPTDRNALNGGAVSSAGATGPFQVLPELWKREWGDINNFEDAAKAAAQNWLKNAAKIGPTPEIGDPNNPKEGTVVFAFKTYNPGSQSYIEAGLKRYQSLGGSTNNGQTSGPAAFLNTKDQFKPVARAASDAGKVFFVGDSIGSAIKDKLKEQYPNIEFDTLPGRGLTGGPAQFQPNGIDVLKASTDKIKNADTVVLELGTNAYDAANFSADVDNAINIIKQAKDSVKIYWIDLAANSPQFQKINTEVYGPMNKTLIDKSNSGNFKLISWFKTVYPEGDPSQPAPTLADSNKLFKAGDNVHPSNPDGVNAYASLVANNLKSGGGTNNTVSASNNCPAANSGGSGNCIDDGAIMKVNDATKLGEAINKYIEQNGGKDAPLKTLGAKFVSGAIRQGVNPFLIVSIAQRESSFGKAVPGNNSESYNSFGLTAASGQPSVSTNGRNWYKWPSWELSLDGGGSEFDEPTYLKKNYLDKGLTKVDQIMMKYAPPSDGNDTAGYIQGIKDGNKKMVDLAGDAISCDGGGQAVRSLKNATVVKSFDGPPINVSSIVVHYTAGQSADGASFVNAIKSNKSCGPQGCSVQVWISDQGQVYQLVDPLNTFTENVNDFNKHSIGIEIDGADENEVMNNSVQFGAVITTIKDLMEIFNIKNEMVCAEPNSKGIFGHMEANDCMNPVPGQGHRDPGANYMAKIRQALGQ
ncbi:N-acetylmuramoyl-L-alanine amidase [Candidatus Saccharibacteria bacterium]|nr:N-acetylmuramoyl-L-alanine amidase [Candidatus Saccharibacteria bacterium]